MTSKELIKLQLIALGEDPTREGLRDTPQRVIRSWGEIYSGYDKDPADLLTTFEAKGYNQIILLKDIELFSMCEHHMLPFFGKAHVAYIPGEHIIGISKLARLVDIYARRLQIQERLGDEVTTALMQYLKPRGAACIIEATHMCMRMRGIGKQHSTMVTSSLKGVFLTDGTVETKLLTMIK
jgi:GTP cyclohydrolase IA